MCLDSHSHYPPPWAEDSSTYCVRKGGREPTQERRQGGVMGMGGRGEQRPPREAGTSRRHRLGAAATHKELSAECWGMGVEVWLTGATSGFGEYQLCPVKW